MSNISETTFRVRYAETDQMSIVHHAAYVVWLEEGRSNWMRSRGHSYAQFEQEGLVLAVSDLQVRFKKAARYDQAITVRCWVEHVRSRQLEFGYEIVDAETQDIFVTATTKHVCLDRAGRVANIPQKWQKFLEQEG
jgi:acyl-CoA thioester hydrolase